MAFTDTEKVGIRRHIGYQAFGAGNVLNFIPFLFMTEYRLLEFRMERMADAEVLIVQDYLLKLDTLELDLYNSKDNLDTESAAVWKHNPYEMKQRNDLYSLWRKKLANYFGVKLGPDANGGGNTVRVIV